MTVYRHHGFQLVVVAKPFGLLLRCCQKGFMGPSAGTPDVSCHPYLTTVRTVAYIQDFENISIANQPTLEKIVIPIYSVTLEEKNIFISGNMTMGLGKNSIGLGPTLYFGCLVITHLLIFTYSFRQSLNKLS